MATQEAAAPVQEVATSFDVSLNEFCARLSATDKRVELIGGFHHVEAKAGHLTDAEAGFMERFVAFCNQPV